MPAVEPVLLSAPLPVPDDDVLSKCKDSINDEVELAAKIQTRLFHGLAAHEQKNRRKTESFCRFSAGFEQKARTVLREWVASGCFRKKSLLT